MAEPGETMLDPKYLGGLIGGEGYAFQNAYVLYCLADWLIDPALVGLQPEGWDDVEAFFQDEDGPGGGGRRREAIQVKDHPVKPAEARDILAEFQRRAASLPPGGWTSAATWCSASTTSWRRPTPIWRPGNSGCCAPWPASAGRWATTCWRRWAGRLPKFRKLRKSGRAWTPRCGRWWTGGWYTTTGKRENTTCTPSCGAARAEAHGQLRDYFATVPPPERVQTLDDLAPAIELYHHTVRAGQYDEAVRLMRDRLVPVPLHFQFSAYQLCIELLRALFPDGEDNPPRLKEEGDQAWTLNALANSYGLSGQPRRAVPLFEGYISISESRGDKTNQAIGLGNLAIRQVELGALRAAGANLHRRIAFCREIEDEFQEAIGHAELGRLLAYRGAWSEAGEELTTALALFEKRRHVQGQAVTWAYRALCAQLLARHAALTGEPIPDPQSPISLAQRALELADEDTRTRYPHPRDYVRTHWLLGAAHRAAGPSTPFDVAQGEGSGREWDAAERHLSGALTRCRGINLVEFEADILLDLARLRKAEGQRDEARRLTEEALLITERSGYVLQGAYTRLFLAELDLEAGEREKARDHARAARALATCDGPPHYTYKVAYEEAGVLLARLGFGT
jgi:tetratricopeptide (TPR) repeat protein